MVLQTKLQHLRSKAKFKKLIKNHEKVIIIAGRMCPVCSSMYPIFERLDEIHADIEIWDWDYDLQSADVIRDLPECEDFWSLPFVIYFKNGKVAEATAGKQTANEIKKIIKRIYK
ncbi:MAG: thioredoxin [Candidatus Lokiarchaeota archaeon]|nr:thioredoxin [Candidatus Lokiarchaeota archaeon]